MRNGRHVADRIYPDPCLTDRSDRRLAAAARALDPNFDFTHTGFDRLACDLRSCLLCGKRCSLSRTAETACSRRGLCNQITVGVRDRDQRIVERSRNVNDPVGNILSLFLFVSLLCWCFCHVIVRRSTFVVRCLHPALVRSLSLATNNEPRTTSGVISCPVPSSSRQLPCAGLFSCGRSCSYAGREPAGFGDDAGRGSSQCPSIA